MNKKQFLKSRHDKVGVLFQVSTQKINIFLEGVDDEMFYRHHLQKRIDIDKVNFIICHSKSNVLFACDWHNKMLDTKWCLTYFVDRDYDNHESDFENLFITEYYSWESYVYEPTVFINYLKSRYNAPEELCNKVAEFLKTEAVAHLENLITWKGLDNKNKFPNMKRYTINEKWEFEYTTKEKKITHEFSQDSNLSEITDYRGKDVKCIINTLFKSGWFKNILQESNYVHDTYDNNIEHHLLQRVKIPQYIQSAIEYISKFTIDDGGR